jgi:hypothetical protein
MDKRLFTKREFLATSLGAGLGLGLNPKSLAASALEAPGAGGQIDLPRDVIRRTVVTTPLFKSPEGFPNALDVDPDGRGLWIGEQKMSGQNAITYQVPEPADLREAAWLVDWNGKLLHTVMTNSRNTSGMAVGGGYVWMVANAAPSGVFQVDMNSREVSHRQVPLGGGGSHGAKYVDGKLWIASTRLRAALRVDTATWTPEYIIPLFNYDRMHDIAFDGAGAMYVITGTNNGAGWEDDRAGIAKYDVATGRRLEYAEFGPENADPHGLAFHDGKLYSCDAGIHPGWPTNVSKSAGYIFRIDLV